MAIEVATLNGTVRTDGTLEVPGTVELRPGPVEVTVRPAATNTSQPNHKRLPGPPPEWRAGVTPAAGLLADSWQQEDDDILNRIQAERKSATLGEVSE